MTVTPDNEWDRCAVCDVPRWGHGLGFVEPPETNARVECDACGTEARGPLALTVAVVGMACVVRRCKGRMRVTPAPSVAEPSP